MKSSSKLGWIGLGNMGSRIAKRLRSAGYPLMVYDRDRSKALELASHGAEIAAGLMELAADADIILSCVSDGTAVRNVYFGANGVLRSAKPGAHIVEMSTVAPETSVDLFRAARDCGVSVCDVAISGSTLAAESGSLTLFGGGDREAFDFIAPIFPAFARQWFYMGPSGCGVAMKLVVNTLLAVGMQAIAEAIAFGDQLGLSRDLLFDTLAKTAVVAPAHIGKLATAKLNDYTAQFPLRLMRKDLDLILSKAADLRVEMPVTTAASDRNALEAASNREEDFSAVIRLTEELTERRSVSRAAEQGHQQ
jgi:3-hydroxyisobutyrate dehydrogenase-like beta-hydroxyacid dehydrogenase